VVASCRNRLRLPKHESARTCAFVRPVEMGVAEESALSPIRPRCIGRRRIVLAWRRDAFSRSGPVRPNAYTLGSRLSWIRLTASEKVFALCL